MYIVYVSYMCIVYVYCIVDISTLSCLWYVWWCC